MAASGASFRIEETSIAALHVSGSPQSALRAPCALSARFRLSCHFEGCRLGRAV
jgi:hypothetical protein